MKNRLEADFSYEYLTPDSPYGSWKTFNLAWYHRPARDLTYFFQLGTFSRKDGQGGLGAAGAYKDWTPWMYTYTDLSLGTNSDYLPRARADNDFNFKLGRGRNVVWTAGLSYIKYFSVRKDFILSTGLTLYLGRWIGTYRLFRNASSPGSVISWSHLFGIGYGREGWQWTWLDFSFGKQAYIAPYLAAPSQVRQGSFLVEASHRRWLGRTWGIYVDASYFKLYNGGYEKYGIAPGVFKEF